MESGPEVNSCSSTCAISYSLKVEVRMTWQDPDRRRRSSAWIGRWEQVTTGRTGTGDERELVAGLVQQVPVTQLACMYLVTPM